MSQDLVKLAKDNGSSDNITIVVVFLKPIEELATMELPVTTKDLSSTDSASNLADVNGLNNNDKDVLYDGITSTSIYVGKDAIDLNEEDKDTEDDEEEELKRKISSSSASSSGAGSSIADLKPNNPFASPDGGGFVYGDVVNPFSGMTSEVKTADDIPAVDESLEGMINEAFGTVTVNKLDDFKNASPSMFDESMFNKSDLLDSSEADKAKDFMASTENSWINAANNVAALSNPFLKGDSGFISPACQSNNHSASSEDSAENHDERENAASSLASTEDVDDEAEEAKEVTKLLSGGIMETQFGDLLLANRETTPTPPIEDTGNLKYF